MLSFASFQTFLSRGGGHSTEVALTLLTQLPRALFLVFPKIDFFQKFILSMRFINSAALLSQWTVQKLKSWLNPSSTTRKYYKKHFFQFRISLSERPEKKPIVIWFQTEKTFFIFFFFRRNFLLIIKYRDRNFLTMLTLKESVEGFSP